MMPGGTPQAYKEIEPIVEKVAAQVDDGPCVMYIGEGGAGNFVKMVHNGIEYGDMQLISGREGGVGNKQQLVGSMLPELCVAVANYGSVEQWDITVCKTRRQALADQCKWHATLGGYLIIIKVGSVSNVGL